MTYYTSCTHIGAVINREAAVNLVYYFFCNFRIQILWPGRETNERLLRCECTHKRNRKKWEVRGGGDSRHGDDDNPGHVSMGFLFYTTYGLQRDIHKHKESNVWVIFTICLADSRQSCWYRSLQIKKMQGALILEGGVTWKTLEKKWTFSISVWSRLSSSKSRVLIRDQEFFNVLWITYDGWEIKKKQPCKLFSTALTLHNMLTPIWPSHFTKNKIKISSEWGYKVPYVLFHCNWKFLINILEL